MHKRFPCLSPFLFPHIRTLIHTNAALSRSACTPDTLHESVSLRQSVEGVIALGSASYESAKGVDLVLAGISAILVDLSDADLYACVVLGLNDAVGRAALAGNVPMGLECQ